MLLKDADWTQVKPTTGALPVGGYVLKITKAKESEIKGWSIVEVVYDVAEGEYAGTCESKPDYQHTFNVFTFDKDGKPSGGFRSFLDVLVESNPKFKIEGFTEVSQLEGLIFGGLIQKYHYTNQNGEDKYRLDVMRQIPADKVRKGDYQMPEEVDKREKKEDNIPDVSDFSGDVDVAF